MDDNDPIIRFRKPSNQTAVDYRSRCSLQSHHISQIRELSYLSRDEDEFQIILIALLIAVYHISNDKKDAMSVDSMSFDSQQHDDDTSTDDDELFDLDEVMSQELGLPALMFDDRQTDYQANSGFSSSSSSSSDSSTNSTDDSSISSSDSSTSSSTDSSMASSSSSSSTAWGFCKDYHYDSAMSLLDDFSSTDMLNLEGVSKFSNDTNDYRNIVSIFSTLLGCSIIDLDTFINSIIDVAAIRQSDWDSVVLSTNSPKRCRTILELDTQASGGCYFQTRFKAEELLTLLVLFFGAFTSDSVVWKENRFTYEEAMLVSMTYMAHGMPYIQMCSTFGHDWTRYGYMCEWFVTFIYHKYFHRLSGRSFEYWAEHYNIDVLREKIFNYICFDDEGERIEGLEHIQFSAFRIFGWIDCFQNVTSRPGSGPIDEFNNRRENEDELQRAFYTHYGHQWGCKNQGAFLPNGMLGSIYTASMAQNDKGLVNMSGIAEELERILQRWKIYVSDLVSVFPALYGDDIYMMCSVIVKRIQGLEGLFHRRCAKSRIDVEHEFGIVSNLFKRLNQKHTWHLLSLKKAVDYHYFTIFFLVNIYTCLRENKTSVKYNLPSPDIEDYLNVTIRDSYDGNDADEDMLAHLATQNNWQL
jgi:hypothetical protein